MNKTLTALTMALMLGISGTAMADCNCKDCYKRSGGYLAGEAQIATVKDAMRMSDDSTVTLKGQIAKQIKKDKYLFKDNTGTITVEIDKDVWKGQSVSPKDTVEITGDIDRDDDRVRVDVDRLIKQ